MSSRTEGQERHHYNRNRNETGRENNIKNLNKNKNCKKHVPPHKTRETELV